MPEYDFDLLRIQYPEGMNKEQFYKLCHVSKRTAQRLLECGLVPCQRREQRTHRYIIAIDDVITYLIQREVLPEQYVLVRNLDITTYRTERLPPQYESRLIALYQDKMNQYPDTLTVRDVRNVTGYSVKTIIKWCQKGIIHCFKAKRVYRIPKHCLLAFMMSSRFRKIGAKSHCHRMIMEDLARHS